MISSNYQSTRISGRSDPYIFLFYSSATHMWLSKFSNSNLYTNGKGVVSLI